MQVMEQLNERVAELETELQGESKRRATAEAQVASMTKKQKAAADVFDLSDGDAASEPPAVITACSEGQRKALVADLYRRLMAANPASAVEAVAAHEASASALQRRNTKIAGSWKLFSREDGCTEYGSITFDRSAAVISDIYMTTTDPESEADEIFAASSNVAPLFGRQEGLTATTLTYATKSKIMREYIKGELAITVVDEDTIEGVLKTLGVVDDTAPCGYGDDSCGFNAVFTGRRCQPAKRHKAQKR